MTAIDKGVGVKTGLTEGKSPYAASVAKTEPRTTAQQQERGAPGLHNSHKSSPQSASDLPFLPSAGGDLQAFMSVPTVQSYRPLHHPLV